jgi:hypothetical protein
MNRPAEMKDASITALSILTTVAFLAFKLLRARQLSQPDPYNNPLTTASTGFLIAFFILWFATLTMAVACGSRLTRTAAVLSWAVIVLGGAWPAVFFANMFLFLHS